MSSRVCSWYSAKMSSGVEPWPSRLRIYSTVSRVPLMVGRPAMMSGLMVMRSSKGDGVSCMAMVGAECQDEGRSWGCCGGWLFLV